MHIGILGINHKSADLPLREKLARVCERLFGTFHSVQFLFSYVLLSTCNRTEIYFHSEDLAETHTFLLNALRHEIQEEFEHRIYSYFGADCFFHLARVTAGVDSALIGETEIQGQVKRAYEEASVYRSLASELHFLFQKSLKIGKNIRSSTRFTHEALSIEEAVLNAAADACEVKASRLLLVGLSEINHKILMKFKEMGLRNITLSNRTHAKAVKVASKEEVDILPWEQLHRWPTYDIAICATKCPHFLFHGSHLLGVTPRLVIDLSVPRNVDPKIGRHTSLLNVDQLNQALDRKRRQKAAEIARIETHHIAKAVESQVAFFRLRELNKPAALEFVDVVG